MFRCRSSASQSSPGVPLLAAIPSPPVRRISAYRYPPRVGGGHEVVEDLVHRCLVKDRDVAVLVDVELQALQLDELLIRGVADVDRREIGKPRARANTGKLG